MPDGWTIPRPYDWSTPVALERIDIPRLPRTIPSGFRVDFEALYADAGIVEAQRLVQEVLDGDVRRQIDETNRRLVARMSHPAFGPRRPAM
jgi:hypothetical protein